MIKNVNGGGKYLMVYTNSASNYMNNYSGAQGVGNLRFNTGNQTMEVYDGQMWQSLKMGESSVSLTPDAVEALDWVNLKREEERKLKELAKQHPAVADQLAAVREAEEKLRMITLLVQT
jgi:hypothetical protein